jgi:ribosomal protein S18 acetylase RimI-like enzyme
VSGDLRVAPLREEDLEAALPLISGYQRFYRVEHPDDERNRSFFRRFLSPGQDGLLLGAWRDGRLVGFATLYWTFSSTRAAEVALLNDIFVSEEDRGGGTGLALLEAAAEASRARGVAAMEWFTHVDNRPAQRLYERIPGIERDTWFGYRVDLG